MRTGLSVIAYITANAGRQKRVREALLDLVARTRREKSCINYDLHQSQDNDSEFAIYENWVEADDLDAHAKSVTSKSPPEYRPRLGRSGFSPDFPGL